MAISTIRIDAKLKRMAARYKKMKARWAVLERKAKLAGTEARKAKLNTRKVKLHGRMDKLVKRMKALVAKKNSIRHVQSKDPKQRKRKAASSKRKVARKGATARKATATQKFTATQIEAGAKFLTCRNLGTIGSDAPITSAEKLESLWRKCCADHIGIDISDEYRDWVKALRKGDAYSVGEVQKALPWLFPKGAIAAPKAAAPKAEGKGRKAADVPTDMFKRLDAAATRVYRQIGGDLAQLTGGDIKQAELIEAVFDAGRLHQMGGDQEAAEYAEQLSWPEIMKLGKKIFPYKTYE